MYNLLQFPQVAENDIPDNGSPMIKTCWSNNKIGCYLQPIV